MNELLEQDLQMKLGLKSFFEGAGYKMFKYELDQLVLGAQDKIASNKLGFIDEKKLCELNYNLGRMDGLNKVLFVLEGLMEELNTNEKMRKV